MLTAQIEESKVGHLAESSLSSNNTAYNSTRGGCKGQESLSELCLFSVCLCIFKLWSCCSWEARGTGCPKCWGVIVALFISFTSQNSHPHRPCPQSTNGWILSINNHQSKAETAMFFSPRFVSNSSGQKLAAQSCRMQHRQIFGTHLNTRRYLRLEIREGKVCSFN